MLIKYSIMHKNESYFIYCFFDYFQVAAELNLTYLNVRFILFTTFFSSNEFSKKNQDLLRRYEALKRRCKYQSYQLNLSYQRAMRNEKNSESQTSSESESHDFF